MSPRVLVISADALSADRLRTELKTVGAEVDHVSADDAIEHAADVRSAHVVVIDLRDVALASDLLAALKGSRRFHETPVLALVPESQLARFDSHIEVDDLVVSPYRSEELRVRLLRLAARTDGALSPNAIKIGDLALDPDNYEVTMAGAPVDLTLKEYELLKYLVMRPGRVFTRDQLLNSVWGYDYVGGTRTVDVHIRRLRAKLGDVGETCIDTIRGVGYAFRPPRPQAQEAPAPQPENTAVK
jgi:DNA-binding response OmpR family regulator